MSRQYVFNMFGGFRTFTLPSTSFTCFPRSVLGGLHICLEFFIANMGRTPGVEEKVTNIQKTGKEQHQWHIEYRHV